ncbi:MAG: 2-succinyl-5-enolpyruvyl-6-hydroxy-3-cyclohexene-1-carboxylic-acid synthase, partial [Chloroflexota bacterium]
MNVENPNTLFSRAFAHSLAALGLENICIAAGSRSTPLTLAFSVNKELNIYTHIDERSSAYFALGISKASQKPTALLCTSGTAAANFYPAVIEANYSETPLIILTADRPLEQRNSGANQTIDQIKLYGEHVRTFTNVSLPEASNLEQIDKYAASLAARAWQDSHYKTPGPVHINFPFNKPLEPNNVDLDPALHHRENPKLAIPLLPKNTASDEQLNLVLNLIEGHPRGIIICGPRSGSQEFCSAVTEIAAETGYPIFADALSGVRFGEQVNGDAVILSYFENYINHPSFTKSEQPTLVIRFGDLPISKNLNMYLGKLSKARHVQISPYGMWRDDQFITTDWLTCDTDDLCQRLLSQEIPIRTNDWAKIFIEAEELSGEVIEKHIEKLEGYSVVQAFALAPNNAVIFAGNSLSVRHIDQFVPAHNKRITVLGNRGASGIDGLVSSALGVSAVEDNQVILILGDLSFYYDMNALLLAKKYGLSLTIIVINNDGGGIFQRLPISNYEPEFTNLFLTPHGLSFEKVSNMFSLEYALINEKNSFKAHLEQAIESNLTSIIEVP